MAGRNRSYGRKTKAKRVGTITRCGTGYLYDNWFCTNSDAAYEYFRKDYHKSLGKVATLRLDHIGNRKERIHSYGFVFSDSYLQSINATIPQIPAKRVKCYFMGLVGISYCRMIGIHDVLRSFPSASTLSDEDYRRIIDRIFSSESRLLFQVGKKEKVGRTSKSLKKRYR